MKKIAIIGGGVAGSTTALFLASLDLEVTLFEKKSTLVDGPPFCHLHAGGNLYREISDSQCITLLKQSIDFAKLYPFVVDYRPTLIALPLSDKSHPKDLLRRLDRLKEEYQKLVEEESANKVLEEVEDYYKVYSKEEIETFKTKECMSNPKTKDEWIISVAKYVDLKTVQFPLIMISEFGLNLFRLASGVSLAIEKTPHITLNLNTTVTDIKKSKNWTLTYQSNQSKKEDFDYIVNASGFRTGMIDDMLNIECERMVEFKSAFVSYCSEYKEIKFPEIIFHGERGTPRGMGQFTPYPNGYFQLHGMTNDITLYSDGLVSNDKIKCQPELKQDFIDKIEKSWTLAEVEERTQNAIHHISQFIPSFKKAKVSPKPLFGAQQISGDDPTLRVAEVSFPLDYYARCEIIKVSSVVDMVKSILEDLSRLGLIERKNIDLRELQSLKEEEISKKAKEIAKEREYPLSLASRISTL